jgi:CRISPR system Cascade subunit CasD
VAKYLVFGLHAPLAAFGAVAVGERRPCWDRPGRSALLGLLAAALGIDRTDEAAHLALDRGYGLAIRTDSPGRLLADYHTAQVPPAKRGRSRLPTRAAELAEPDLQTVLTRREYRTDAMHLIAFWAQPEAPHTLETLADALRKPAFTLYVGRKSCPLGLPLHPLLLDAPSPAQAFAAREAHAGPPERALRQLLQARAGAVTVDAEAAEKSDIVRVERRRDRLVSRARWQFSLRDEAVLRRPEGSA